MVNPWIILRAYRLKRATKRLRRARENALRIHRGKRPRYPCFEECWRCIVGCLKNYFCKAFCPCCLHPKVKKREEEEDNNSKSFWRRPCLANTFENYTVKSFLGFLLGLFLTTGIFFFLLYQLNCSPKITTLICCILGVILTNGLAFKSEFRCIILLVLPTMFSSRGRTVLMAYTYILVMSGPFKNALRNANVLVNSLNCGQEIVINQTKAMLKTIFAPLIAIVDIMRDILKALKEFARMMKQAFIAIRDLFLEIINAIKVVFQWLQSIVSICSNKYGSPYERCNKAFDEAIEDCRVKMGIFKFLCYIVSAIKYVCEIARIVDLLCIISKAIKIGIIDPLKEHFKEFARQMYHEFYVNITFVHYYNFSLEQSKSFRDIRGDIQEEIRYRMELFTHFIDWTNLGMAMFFLVVLFRAYVYRIQYLTADHFDNLYINFHIQAIDERRAAMGKETILPLTHQEKWKYVHTFSPRLASPERRQLLVAGTLLLLSGLQAGLSMGLDYSLHYLLKLMNFYGRLETKEQMPTTIQIQVKGEGVMADMYRQMVTQFDPLMKSTPMFDFTTCLPIPVPLDLDKYRKIGMLYGLCFLLALTESYGLRLRHVVCSIYYPEREKLRAVWLYNHILRTRGGMRRFLRRAIRRKVYGDDTFEKISFFDRLVGKSILLTRILQALGRSKVYCVSCGEPGKPDDSENFKKCSNPGCKGLYCNACFDDLGNKCTLCLKPVEYGDQSDESEEKDSSEDEEYKNMESSDDEDYVYQFGRRRQSSSSEDEEEEKDRGSSPQKKRDLATIDDFSDEEQGSYV